MEGFAGSRRVIRVVLTGSESTGKTTLARQLAAHYGVEWVPEFVREYATRKGSAIELADHGPIAHGQIALEEAFLARARRMLIQDTDLLSTVVYCGHYFGVCPAWIERELLGRLPQLYLLMDIDMPWVPDPVRDRGHVREQMQGLFRETLERVGAHYVTISGDHAARRASATAAVERLLSSPG
jgi:NadR type nicotinamide-nucleotide adenylyltransferase